MIKYSCCCSLVVTKQSSSKQKMINKIKKLLTDDWKTDKIVEVVT